MTRRQKAQDQIVRVSLLEVGTNEPITTHLLGQTNVHGILYVVAPHLLHVQQYPAPFTCSRVRVAIFITNEHMHVYVRCMRATFFHERAHACVRKAHARDTIILARVEVGSGRVEVGSSRVEVGNLQWKSLLGHGR